MVSVDVYRTDVERHGDVRLLGIVLFLARPPPVW